MSEVNSILREGLTALSCPADAADVLERYGEALLRQNQVMNLTAITEPEQVARLHMLDCAAAASMLELCGKQVLDVGSGAGFPGLVWRLLTPDCEMTLLDSLEKRVSWLRTVAPELGAADVRCVHGRAEELGQDTAWRERYDVVTSRAVADLRMLSELCLPFVKVGGVFAALKSVECGDEVNAAARGISILGGRLLPWRDYTIPGSNVRHRLVLVEKVRPTPAKYPRRFAKLKSKPL